MATPARDESVRQHAPSPDYSIYEANPVGPIGRAAVDHAAEVRVAFGIDGDQDAWYAAECWRMRERAPA